MSGVELVAGLGFGSPGLPYLREYWRPGGATVHTLYHTAARLAALYGRLPVATKSVPSDRIKAALPLIALTKVGLWRLVCGHDSRRPHLLAVWTCASNGILSNQTD